MTGFVDLPEQMRVFEFARALDVPAGEVLIRMKRLDIETNSVLKSIDREAMRLVLEDYRAGSNGTATPPDPDLVVGLLGSMNGAEAGLSDLTDPDLDAGPAAEETVEPTEAEVTIAEEGHNEDTEDGPSADTLDLDEDTLEPLPDLLSEDAPPASTETDMKLDDDTPPARSYGRPSGWSAWTPDDQSEEEANLHTGDSPVDGGENSNEAAPDEDETSPTESARFRALASGAGQRARGVSSRYMSLSARKRILLVGVAILFGTTLLTTLYAWLRPAYAAESDIVINLSGLGSEEITREVQSLSVVAGSQTVLAPVAESFDMSIPELQSSFESNIVGDSTVLRFTVTAGDPDSALAMNEAIVAAYLDVANQPIDRSEVEFIDSRIALVQGQIADLDLELGSLETEEAANAGARLQIETERAVAQAQLADLEGRLVDLRASGDPPAGSITFVEGQINETEARLGDLVAEAQMLEGQDAGTRSAANRLRDERIVLRSELQALESMKVEFELEEISGSRVSVLAPGHVVDDPVGLTPTRAIALGLLVGGALAFAWVVGATQLRRHR